MFGCQVKPFIPGIVLEVNDREVAVPSGLRLPGIITLTSDDLAGEGTHVSGDELKWTRTEVEMDVNGQYEVCYQGTTMVRGGFSFIESLPRSS